MLPTLSSSCEFSFLTSFLAKGVLSSVGRKWKGGRGVAGSMSEYGVANEKVRIVGSGIEIAMKSKLETEESVLLVLVTS